MPSDSRLLREIYDKDITGMLVYDANGQVVGRVQKEISEVDMYTMRYLVVELEATPRSYAIPMDTVVEINEQGIRLDLDCQALAFLPRYRNCLSPAFEKEVHLALARIPYWQYEERK